MESIYVYHMYQEDTNTIINTNNNNNNNNESVFTINLNFNHSLELYYPEHTQIPLNNIQDSYTLLRNNLFTQEELLSSTTRSMLSNTGVSSDFLEFLTCEVLSFVSYMLNDPINVNSRELTLVLFVYVVTPYNDQQVIDGVLSELMQLQGDHVPGSTRFRSATSSSIDGLKRVKLDCPFSIDERCVICLEGFLLGEEVRILPCGHFFHGSCIVRWLETSHYCPVCRFEMPC